MLHSNPKSFSAFAFLLAATTSLSLLFTSPSQAATAQTTITLTKPITARGFTDSLGVNTHLDNVGNGNAYTNVAAMETELRYIGVRYVRDNIFAPSTLTVLQKVNKDVGTKYDIILNENFSTEIASLKSNTALLAEVEGPNEVDIWPTNYKGMYGGKASAALQTDIYKMMKSTAGLTGFPVDNLTIADESYIPQVGNLAAYCDYSNMHLYPQWGSNATLSDNLDWSINSVLPLARGKSNVITEFGWWTQPMRDGVPNDVQAKYMLNFFFDAMAKGIHRSYIYELNDEYNDAQGTDFQKHFGLFTASGTPKTSATALKSLTTILADTTPLTATTAITTKISYASSGAPIKSMLMQRGDKTFILALWQDAWIWNIDSLQKVNVATKQALVDFGLTAKTVQVYDPMIGTTATATYTNQAGRTFMVPDHPIFVFFK